MELPKLIILLSCIYQNLASEHTIPVEHYETELQDLGQHVEIPETPVRVIKITKTVAVKIPVPNPVKVIEKVPYPVHVSKPYPVPVPQIVHVPQAVHTKTPHRHEALDVSYSGNGNSEHSSYQVQEAPTYGSSSNSDLHSHHQLLGQSYQGNSYGADEHLSGGSDVGGNYDNPNRYYGYSGDNEGHGTSESKSYEHAIKDYLQKKHPNVNRGSSGNHYH